ncbi:hypothetical protein WB388_08865 [Streptomyces brasiliscabiei]|uniref:Uncharacterized protein n=1 Tax=Streptomyces brasiliscabiei TaxID=2736302 RepID=A0ABU8G9X2_9ACTN
MSDSIAFGRPFVLQRDRDISGVSGVGIVADGIVFPDGHAAIHWRGKWALTTPHPDGLDSILDIHDHGGQGDLHIIWPDHDEMRQKTLADVVEAFDVPAEMCGTEAERAHLHRQISRALTAEHLRRAGEQIVASPEEHCASFADAVMPVVVQVLEQRDRAKAAAGRAYLLADRWQAAHGASQFLVRAAGAELRDELDGPAADESSPAAKHFVHPAANMQASEPEKVDENGLQCVCGAPVEETVTADQGLVWIHRPGSDTKCLDAWPRCPECQMPHLLEPDRPPLCRSVLAHLDKSDGAVAAAECSALYTRFSNDWRQCIRAAQHRRDHVDANGFHWSDTVAVYPVAEPEPEHGQSAGYVSSFSTSPGHACVEAAMQRAIAAGLRVENRALREKSVLLEQTRREMADERQRIYATVQDARTRARISGAWGVLQALEPVPVPDETPDPLAPHTGPLTAVEVRDPCPYCEDCPLVPRTFMAIHIREQHPDVTLASHDNGTSEWTKTGLDSRNAQAREGVAEDSQPDTVTDPAWLRGQYAAAIREALGDGPWAVVAHRAADAALGVRDRHLEQLRHRLALAEATLSDRAEGESADAASGSYAHRAEQAETERDQLAAEVKRLGNWCLGLSKRAKTAAADRDRYHDELAVNETDRVAAVSRAERAEAALIEARATGQRLNRRAQVAESGLATIRRAVAQWSTDERGTYVPLRTITTIAKAIGREVENPRWLLHYQRVEQAETALAEAQQVISMQKELIGTLRSVVATAMTDREDQGVSREECARCGRDHMADLETAIREADIEYQAAFPPTADGPARPGQLPDGAHRTPRQSAYEAVQAHIDSLGAGWPSTKSGQTAHIWIAVNRALDAAGHAAAPETVCTLPHEMEA